MSSTLSNLQVNRAKTTKKVKETHYLASTMKMNFNNKEPEKQRVKIYRLKVFACEVKNYFVKKGNVFVSQDEILSDFIKAGWSRSYVYWRIKKYSQGIVKRKFGVEKPDILEPLILEVSRLELDGVFGVCYKLNDCWREISNEDIAKAFHGQ